MIPIVFPVIRSLIPTTKLALFFDLNPSFLLIEDFPSKSRNCFLFLRKSVCPESALRFFWIRHTGVCPLSELSDGWWFLSLLDRILSHKPPWISLDIFPRQHSRWYGNAIRLWLWGVDDEVTGRILENKKIQFMLQSEEAMSTIIRCGPWSFNDWMCVIQKWTPIHTDEDLKKIPFWVQTRGIPLHFLTLRMVTQIGHRFGHFLETAFEGEGAVLVDYVRVRLVCHIDVPLRFQQISQFGDEACVLKMRYEKLRNFCSTCDLLVFVSLQTLHRYYAHTKEILVQFDCVCIDCVVELWLHQFGFSGIAMSRLHIGLFNYWRQVLICIAQVCWLRKALVMYRWESIDAGESETLIGTGHLRDYDDESSPESSNVLISTKRQDTALFSTTSISHFKSKVMPKAFWSFSYKLLANIKYVKEGHNRLFHLLAWQRPARIAWLLSTLSSKLFQFPIFAYNGCIVLVLYFVNSL